MFDRELPHQLITTPLEERERQRKEALDAFLKRAEQGFVITNPGQTFDRTKLGQYDFPTITNGVSTMMEIDGNRLPTGIYIQRLVGYTMPNELKGLPDNYIVLSAVVYAQDPSNHLGPIALKDYFTGMNDLGKLAESQTQGEPSMGVLFLGHLTGGKYIQPGNIGDLLTKCRDFLRNPIDTGLRVSYVGTLQRGFLMNMVNMMTSIFKLTDRFQGFVNIQELLSDAREAILEHAKKHGVISE